MMIKKDHSVHYSVRNVTILGSFKTMCKSDECYMYENSLSDKSSDSIYKNIKQRATWLIKMRLCAYCENTSEKHFDLII